MSNDTDHAIYALHLLGWPLPAIARAFALSERDAGKARKRHWNALGRPAPEPVPAPQTGQVCPQTWDLEAYLHAAAEVNVTVHLPPVTVLPGEKVFDAMQRLGVSPTYAEGGTPSSLGSQLLAEPTPERPAWAT